MRLTTRLPFGSPTRHYLGAPLAAVLASLPLLAAAPASAATTSVALPYEAGETARVIEGYNGGTHQGPSLYALDLVLADGQTSGAPVLAPIDGSVTWAFAPGDGNGCMEIVTPDNKFGVMLCHVLLSRPFNRGERVARGEVVGTVGEPGTLGNNGTAHVHMDLHLGGRDDNPVPFSAADGYLSVEGMDLPATGAANEHGGETFTSSNTESPAPPQPTPTVPQLAGRTSAPTAAPALKPLAIQRNHCLVGTTPTFSAGFAALKAQLGDAMGSPASCEFPDPSGSGDVQQLTTTGLAFWRKSTNTPTFTDGYNHWATTASGWTAWTGQAIDPPNA